VPKLSKKQAKEIERAEAWGVGGGGYLLPEGRYAARLKAVGTGTGPAGTYWSFEYSKLHNEEGEEQRGRQWENVSLSDKARGKMKSVFDAFGYSTDSDTDEMIGEWVVLHLVQEVQSQGKRAGQTVNRIVGVTAFDDAEWPFDIDEVGEDEDRNGGAANGEAADDDF
jgi:hypothetical protein